jgi:transposase
MELTTILNEYYRQPGFVYYKARFGAGNKAIEMPVRPRKGSKGICARCEKPSPGYDTLPARLFEFIPFWGYAVFLIHARRRVQCPDCGIGAEKLPWSDGKHHSTKAHMLFLAHWARKLSWKEVAESFSSSWDQVHDVVECVVEWGLQHRSLKSIFAIGVDEIP